MPYYRGGFEAVGGLDAEPDYLYYNGDIINNNNLDQANGIALPDPAVRFNETRDKALIKNSSEYHFSIIRFTMNGANLDLPLFIPQIPLDGTVSYDPFNNWVQTIYSFTGSLQQKWNLPASDISGAPLVVKTITLVTPEQFVYWIPQFRNPSIAPPPVPGELIYSQNLSSRWWWATDYSYVVNLFNRTLDTMWAFLYGQWATQWADISGGVVNPYTNVADFLTGVGIPPNLLYNNTDRTLSLFADSDCFGQRLMNFTNLGTIGTPATPPYARLFMNANMYGLMSGFTSTYWNLTTIPATYPVTLDYIYNFPDLTGCTGCTYEINFFNKFYTNIVDYRIPPYSGTPPLGFVPSTGLGASYNFQKVYYVVYQDFKCVDTLWSPIASIVFESTLLPLVRETTGKPVVLGSSNTGNSSSTTPSAFQPIITDIAIDQSTSGADAYRGFLYYAPQAEYRLVDIAGDQEIRNIDISVYWKSRLTGEYIQVQMFNGSSVNVKAMFRRKTATMPKGNR